ncbi:MULTISPECIES: acyltransferase [Lactococcus]|uniref:acyltransferase n=1 Tax=Lactococcus TaxID=1357 RepID=UPI0022E5142E|nr:MULTISPECIES: acyltransferase [Lactococcus]MDT2895503.1 acyltransferase [Lactococcus lactis]
MKIKNYIEKIIRRLLNKPNFSLSDDIPLMYIVYDGLSFIKGIFRGKIRKVGMGKVGKKLKIGKHVQFRRKKLIFLGDNVRIENNVLLNGLSKKGIVLGNNVKIGAYSSLIVSGTLSDLGKEIIIGDNTSFSEFTFFGGAGGIKVGNDVISGQNVRFHSENHNFSNNNELIRLQGVSRKGIEVGNNVWIGAGAIFLDGAKVGNNSVVAANSVVQKEFPDNVVIGGIPAKIIKNREERGKNK